MFISEKFEAYYETLSYEDKIEAMRVVNMLCDEHSRMMDEKHKKLLMIGEISTKLLFESLSGNNTKEITKQMRQLKEETEKTAKFMPIERYIEINFGL